MPRNSGQNADPLHPVKPAERGLTATLRAVPRPRAAAGAAGAPLSPDVIPNAVRDLLFLPLAAPLATIHRPAMPLAEIDRNPRKRSPASR